MTRPADLTARRSAVTETARNVVVSAGAGTGKTSLIVERLLVGLGGGTVALRSIAAITFTEKAAGELRFRLAEGLEELARLASEGTAADSPAGRALVHLTESGKDRAAIAARSRAAVVHLDRATVTTIHGFCADILRSHPIEAGLPPGFQVDRGPASMRVAREEWASFLEQELGPAASREDVWRAALSVLGSSELETLGRGLARGAVPTAVLAAPYQPVDFAATLGANAARIASELRTAADGTRGLTPAPQEWIDEAVAALTLAGRGDVAGAKRAIENGERIPKDSLSVDGKRVDRADAERLESLGRQAIQLIRAIAKLDEDAVSAAMTAVLPYARRLRERLHRSGLVDFDTLLVATRDLLRDHPSVRDVLKTRFTSILVDEFQDTDPLQYEIVFFLAEPMGQAARDAWSSPLVPGRLFIVGDAKQSIYRFRGADYTAYRRAVARIKEHGGLELALTANFRSVPGILDPINALGAAWTPSDHLPRYEPIVPEIAEGGRPAVEIWTTPSGRASAEERRRAEGQAIAAEIQALKAAGTDYADILILMRGFTNVPLYLRELREAGVPFIASGGKTFYERSEIVQALGVLRAVADPADRIAWLAFMRSPAGAVTDAELASGAPVLQAAERRLEALRAEVEALPVDVIVRYVLERTGLFALNGLGFEGAQRVANLEKLASDASEFARDGRLSLLELLDALAERPKGEEEGDSPLADETTNAVRVMTIHKAKGLEAPIVILADAAAGRSDFGEREWKIGIARDGGSEHLLVEGPKFTNTAFAIGKIENRAHEAAEDVRLLYVALTRAKRRLVVLTGTTNGQAGPWMQALVGWGYDAKLPPADGAPLHAGAVGFRLINPRPQPALERAGVPAGAREAVDRYLTATRASRGAEFRSPSAEVHVPVFGTSTLDAAMARAVGIAVHEHLAGLREAVPDEARVILDDFAKSPLSSRLASVDVVGREVPILLAGDDGALWRGSVDLLYRDPDGTIVIADYKTDASLENAADRHRDQLRLYADAVGRALPGRRVRAELWMLRHGEIVRLDAPPPKRRESRDRRLFD